MAPLRPSLTFACPCRRWVSLRHEREFADVSVCPTSSHFNLRICDRTGSFRENPFRSQGSKFKPKSGLMLIAQDRKRTTETDMSAAIARLLPRASATLVADLET